MPKTLSDRFLLRKMKRQFNKKTFEAQNMLLSSMTHVSPEWYHQSRVNYRYIYSNLKSFWPDWAKKQFNPFQDNAKQPESEFHCLNNSFQSHFKFLPNDKVSQFTVNESLFISFPKCFWSSLFKVSINNGELVSPFENKTRLCHNKNQIIAESTVNDIEFKAIVVFTDTLHIQLTIQNLSKKPQFVSLYGTILPFNEEGVGFISSIQYTSKQQFIINDSSILSLSDKPDNIICSTYQDGDIYNLISEWEMIFKSRCDQGMASALYAYNFDIPGNESTSLSLTIHHLEHFITPLFNFFRIKNNTYQDLLSRYAHSNLIDQAGFSKENTIFKLTNLPDTFENIDRILSHFLINNNSEQPLNDSLETAYYHLKTLLQLGANDSVKTYLLEMHNQRKSHINNPCIFTQSQKKLLLEILCFENISLFHIEDTKYSQKNFQKRLMRTILDDSFIQFISTINLNQFNSIIDGKKSFLLCIKLFVMSVLIDKIIRQKVSSNKLLLVQKVCHDYLNIIFNHSDLVKNIIEEFYNTPDLSVGFKLFITDVFFTQLPSDQFPIEYLISLLSKNMFKNHFFDHQNHHHFSEKNSLIFSLIYREQQSPILKTYLNSVNLLGLFHDPKSFYHQFSVYPKQLVSYHNVFLASFFKRLYTIKNNVFIIHANTWFEEISFEHLSTEYGKFSMSILKQSDKKSTKLQLNHEFRQSPTQFQFKCNPKFKFYSVNQLSSSPKPISDHMIEIPLDIKIIYLY